MDFLCPNALLYNPIPSKGSFAVNVFFFIIPYLEDLAKGKGEPELAHALFFALRRTGPGVVVWVKHLRPLPRGKKELILQLQARFCTPSSNR